jgi:hypothetical protein
MNTARETVRRPILDLVAQTPDEGHLELYCVCAYCREGHSGMCVAEIVESASACPASAVPSEQVRKWST